MFTVADGAKLQTLANMFNLTLSTEVTPVLTEYLAKQGAYVANDKEGSPCVNRGWWLTGRDLKIDETDLVNFLTQNKLPAQLQVTSVGTAQVNIVQPTNLSTATIATPSYSQQAKAWTTDKIQTGLAFSKSGTSAMYNHRAELGLMALGLTMGAAATLLAVKGAPKLTMQMPRLNLKLKS